MSLKENVNSVLRAVGLKAVEIKLAQMKSEDGVTIFEAEEFAPEFSVGIVQEEGIVPCPVGEFILEDGSIMVVEVEGVIAEIKPMEEEETPAVEIEVEAESEVPSASSEPVAKKIIESVSKETFFSENIELKAEIEVLKSQIEALTPKVEEVVELAKDEEVDVIRFNPENSNEVETFRYAKNANRTRLDSILEKFNK